MSDLADKAQREEVIVRKKANGCHNPEQCGCSSDPFDTITFGWGKLDDYGYWSHPCAPCARAFEKAVPEYGKCWPFEEPSR